MFKCAANRLVLVIFLCIQPSLFAGTFTQVEILKESKRQYSLSDILHDDPIFETYSEGPSDRQKNSYWLRFVYHKNDIQKANYLSLPFILYQTLDLYYRVNDSMYHYKSGVSLEFKKRDLPLPTLYLTLPNTTDSTVCWLHVTGFYNYAYFFSEISHEELTVKEVQSSSLEYFLIGLSFLACIFSLIFFIYLNDKLYLFYGIFSLMLILSRLTYKGIIFDYVSQYYQLSSLKPIYNLYAITYAGVNIALLFYFFYFLKFNTRSKRYHVIFYSLAFLRFVFLAINILTKVPYIHPWLDGRILDLAIHCFIFVCILKTPSKYYKPAVLAMVSLLLVMTGNLTFLFQEWGLFEIETGGYFFFVNIAGLEVIIFAVSMAYRTQFLKKEHDIAVQRVVENLKASELLKDKLNKELERKVEERTEQISKMNEILKSHNIVLKSEVENAIEARIFQKVLGFEDFKKTFPDDETCYQYLAKIKWKPKEDYKCKKCGYEGYTDMKNFSRRCGKCSYTESVTSGTVFQHLKFPILKAFYIAYRTSLSTKDDATLMQLSEEIDLRQATVWTFKQKILALIESNKSKKKHKDGWTHLIELSISKNSKGQ